MWPILRIAFRSVLLQRKRSLLIGFAVALSTLLLLTSNAVMNGVERQVLRGYLNLQSGHVAVVWSGMKEVSNMDTARFLTRLRSFDSAKEDDNRKAIDRLLAYLDGRDEVEAYFLTVRKSVQMKSGGESASIIVYGLDEPASRHLQDSRAIQMAEGELLADGADSIAVSQEYAEDNGLQIGDRVTLETTTEEGRNAAEFVVRGIYANGAGYDNMYGFVHEEAARELLGYEAPFFDAARIYLKDPADAEAFAHDLDAHLTAESDVLRAESYEEASAFYTNTPRNLKFFFNVFVVFLLGIIALGLRSTIGINLFQRMREFGTLRAIGFSRMQNYLLIMLELWTLSMIAMLVALAIAGTFTAVFGRTGIYVGPGPISYALGGESFYPELKVTDVVLVLILILLFAILSTLGPGLRISYQKITDLLLNRQKKVSLLREMFAGSRPAQRGGRHEQFSA